MCPCLCEDSTPRLDDISANGHVRYVAQRDRAYKVLCACYFLFLAQLMKCASTDVGALKRFSSHFL